MTKLIPADEIAKFVPANIAASTVGGKLVMLPRAQFDVSALYYQKNLYTDDAKKAAFKTKYGYDLAPPDTGSRCQTKLSSFPILQISTASNLLEKKKRSMAVSMKWS